MAKLLIRLGDNPNAVVDPAAWRAGDVISVHPDDWSPAAMEDRAIKQYRWGLIRVEKTDPEVLVDLIEPDVELGDQGEFRQKSRRRKKIDLTKLGHSRHRKLYRGRTAEFASEAELREVVTLRESEPGDGQWSQ